MDEFYTNLVDIFEVDEVNPDSVLRDFENWDSLTVLSVLADGGRHIWCRPIGGRFAVYAPRPANSRFYCRQ